MELKTPMVFVKHITAAQRGNAASIQYLCDHTSGQFVNICREYDLSNSEIEAVLSKAYGLIFDNIKSVKNPQKFMSWASDLVRDCCEEIVQAKLADSEASYTEPAYAPDAEEAAIAAEETAASAALLTAGAAAGAVLPAAAAAGTAASAAPAEGLTASVSGGEPAGSGKTSAFYDDNAYLEPASTFDKEITYADETPAEPLPEDKRVIPVDELVYHPDAGFYSSDEPQTMPEESVPEMQADATEPAVYETPAYEEPAYEEPTYATPVNEAPAYEEPAYEAPVNETPAYEEPVYTAPVNETPDYTAPSHAPVRDADEPDVDLIEREEPAAVSGKAPYEEDAIDVNESDYDDEADEDENETQSGLAFRTKVLIGLLCVFIFGACVGVGYAISKGMTADDGTVSSSVPVYTETPTPEATVTETPAQSAASSAAESADSSKSESTEPAATQKPEAGSGESTASEPVIPAGEATAREDLGTYLGETFASVFRDYPDIPRSVYRGELSYANSFIGFIGSYDATQPVSATVVESVSLLSEAENFNINGFYVGMTADDAESLAAAGGYTELEMPAESSREYVDAQGNILTLTIDSGLVKNVTLRMETADDVTMQVADSVTEEAAN